MSAIATFTKLPMSSIDALRTAAAPKKRLFGSPKDVFPDLVRERGVEVAEYRWSGHVMAAVIPYLDEKLGINLGSELSDLGSFLSEKRDSSFIPLTFADKRKLDRLEPDVSEAELRDYYNQLFEADEPDIGTAMKDGILAIAMALSTVDTESFVLLHIG